MDASVQDGAVRLRHREPAACLLAEFGQWGHVLFANGYTGAPTMASTS